MYMAYHAMFFISMHVMIGWKIGVTWYNQVCTKWDWLVNGLYKINAESIRLVLDVEQFGASSDLIVPTPNVQKLKKCQFFFYASLLRYSMDSTEMPMSIFQPRILRHWGEC